jgi:DNA-binding NarL/FixJ family response regulator
MVADEVDLTLEGVRTVLLEQHNIHIAGLYQTLAALLRGLARMPADIAVMSDRLEPDLDVLSLVSRVQQVAPRTDLLITGRQADGLVVHELLQAGVKGYLFKSDPLSEDIPNALRAVMRGRLYLSPTANAEYLTSIQSGRLRWKLDDEALEVLRQLAQGQRPQEIALLRGVPVRRIYWVANKLRRRFNAETNEQLMVRAAEEGFLP